MTVKFAVFPGFVASINDGQEHFIGFARLCELHQVNPSECVDMSKPGSRVGRYTGNLKQLRVSKAGSYPLFKP